MGFYRIFEARKSPDYYGNNGVIFAHEISNKNVIFSLVLMGFYRIFEARRSPDCHGNIDVIFANVIPFLFINLAPANYPVAFWKVFEEGFSSRAIGVAIVTTYKKSYSHTENSFRDCMETSDSILLNVVVTRSTMSADV